MGKIDRPPGERSLTLLREARRSLRVARRTLCYSPALPEAAQALVTCWDALRAALDSSALDSAEQHAQPSRDAFPSGVDLARFDESLAGTRALARGSRSPQPEAVDAALLLELRDQLDWLFRAIASQELAERAGAPWGARLRRPSWPGLLGALAVAGLMLAGIAGDSPAPRPWRASFHRGLELGVGARVAAPVIRYQPRIDFDWQRRAPVPGLSANEFSIRWDTCLRIPEVPSGIIKLGFQLRSDDDARVWLDEHPVLVGWSRRGVSRQSGGVPASSGRHHMRVEYRDITGPAYVSLEIQDDTNRRSLPRQWLSAPPRPFRPNDPCHLAEGGTR